jgi:hypothetical protein
MRRLRRIMIVVAIVFGGLVLAARWYLRSPFVARQAAERLATLLGGPVQVEHAQIGLESSSLEGVQLREPGAPPGEPPWLSVASVHADVSLWDLLSGKGMPQHVELKGAKLLLRFNARGSLLTRLPSGGQGVGKWQTGSPLPTLGIQQSQVTFRREGGDDVVVNEVNATMQPEDGKLVLSGEGTNPRWGKLLLRGKIDPCSGASTVTLKSAGTVHVTRQMLRELPFVSSTVWQEVEAAGETPVDVNLTHEPSTGQLHYRVALKPKDTKVIVPAADLEASRASGELIIDDGLVRLRDVKGTAYMGSLELDGDLDFRGSASRLDFRKVEAHGLDVHALPASWGLPTELEGRLDGSGRVDITLDRGNVSSSGDAKAEIRDARLAGQPVDGPIEIELAPEGPPLHAQPPRANERGEGGGAPAPKPRRMGPALLKIKLNLKDADLTQMVQKLALKLPFAVGGRLNFQGQAAIPMSSTRDLRGYRFRGNATITNAQLGDVRLARIEAAALYEDGVLRLDNVYGAALGAPLPTEKAELGTFRGKLLAQIAPAGELTGELTLNRLPLNQAARELGWKEDLASEITGSVSAKVSLKGLEKDRHWDGSGQMRVTRARAYGWTLDDAGADLKFGGQTLTLTKVHGILEGTQITGSGELLLEEPYAYRATVKLPGADLSALERLAEELRPPVQVGGRATLTAEVSGALQPFRLRSSGTAVLTALKVDQVTLQEGKLAWESDQDQLTIKNLTAKLYGGEMNGGAVVPLNSRGAGKVDLALKDIEVGRLLKEADVGLPIEGRAGGTVKGTFPSAPPGKERPVDLTLDLKAPHLIVQGLDAEGLHGKVRYAGGDITYDFEAKALGGTVQMDGTVPHEAPAGDEETGTGKLRVHGVRLDRLGPAFGARRVDWPLAGVVDLAVDFRYQGPDRTPVGHGRLVVQNLAWDGSAWLGMVQAEVVMAHGRLEVRDATTRLARGDVRAGLTLSWKHPQLNEYTVRVSQVEVAELLAPWPGLKGRILGPLSGSARGHLGGEWKSYGSVALARGKVDGIEVSNWRIPFRAVYFPKARRGQLAIQGASGTVAMGQVTGEATYHWGAMRELKGKLQFNNVQLRALLHAAAESAYLGSGRLTGRLNFSGPGLVGLDQLTAYLDARLVQVRATGSPVLRQLLPTLGMSSSSSFQSGQVRARLAGGVVRIERLSLQGGPGDLYATGTVTTQGRLGVDVHASARWVGMSANRLPLSTVTAGPARVVGRVSNSLTRNLIHVRVNGTIQAPIVQIMPVRMLEEDALRFFLGRG